MHPFHLPARACYLGSRVDRPPYLFYGTRVSFFSAKVRCALRAKGLAFREIEPTPEVYRDVIVPRTGLAFIPVLVTPDDDALQDSSAILDELERRHPAPALYPRRRCSASSRTSSSSTPTSSRVLPAMHYRWSFPESEAQARRDFAAATGDAERASRFADRMQGSIRALGVVPESAAAIEAHTRALLDALSAHFASAAVPARHPPVPRRLRADGPAVRPSLQRRRARAPAPRDRARGCASGSCA